MTGARLTQVDCGSPYVRGNFATNVVYCAIRFLAVQRKNVGARPSHGGGRRFNPYRVHHIPQRVSGYLDGHRSNRLAPTCGAGRS
jgi:hypothetical protein